MRSEKIPNTPLNGSELKEYALIRVREQLDREWMFNAGMTYPSVSFDISIRFHMTNAAFPEYASVATAPVSGVFNGPTPEEDFNPESDQVLCATDIKVAVDNPNLIRIHNDMPITVSDPAPLKPGQIIPQIETRTIQVYTSDYPDLSQPIVEDVSDQVASVFKIDKRKLRRSLRRGDQ